MNPWLFVTGAYAVAVILIAALLLWSHAAMRRAETAAAALKRQ